MGNSGPKGKGQERKAKCRQLILGWSHNLIYDFKNNDRLQNRGIDLGFLEQYKIQEFQSSRVS